MDAVLHLILYAGGVRLTRLSIRLLGFAVTVKILRALLSVGRRRTRQAPSVADLAADVHAVSGPPYHANCLARSVFLWYVMQRHGFDGSLRIGVTLDSDVLEGHAWVELDGSVVNDDEDIAESFAVFDKDPTGIVFT